MLQEILHQVHYLLEYLVYYVDIGVMYFSAYLWWIVLLIIFSADIFMAYRKSSRRIKAQRDARKDQE